MKYLIVSLLAIILFSCGGTSYETFKNSEFGFKMDYPTGWDTNKLDLRMAFMAVEPFTDSLDIYQEGMSVSAYDNQGQTLQDIVDQNIEVTKYYFKDPDITQKAFTNSNGVEGIRLKVAFGSENLNLFNTAVFINHKSQLFTITQSCEQHKEKKYKNIFDKILDSFDWID